MSGIANRQAKDSEFELQAALVISEAIPIDFLGEFFAGLGRGFGGRWGYSRSVGTQLRGGVPSTYQADFREGFLSAAERRFLFPVRAL
jgi:hypothetical protein